MKSLSVRISVIAAIAVIAVSCASVSNISVSNASNNNLPQGSFIYALPQTVIDVRVVAEEISIIPGPYEKYAQKYLGIQHAPTKAEKVYNLKNISVSRHLEADPDFIYIVNGLADPQKYPGLGNLLTDSLILPASGFAADLATSFIWPVQSNELQYTDLSVKRNFEAEKDIEISMVLPDTNYIAPRVTSRSTLKEKTMEQKAEEAANFLIKLKKRRFKLVAGQYEYMPEGESMASALKELARIEEEYLALFIGRRMVTEVRRNYHVTPESTGSVNRLVIFRFSPSNGFVDAADNQGIPVVLELTPMNKVRELGNQKSPLKPQSNLIPFRIPDQANLRLLAGEQIWAEAIYPVYQFGAPVTMTIMP